MDYNSANKLFSFLEKELNEGRGDISGKAEKLADGRIKLSLKGLTGNSLDLSISKLDIKTEEAKVEATKVDSAKVDTTKVEATKVEEPKLEEKPTATPVDTSKIDAPKGDVQPKIGGEAQLEPKPKTTY